MKRALALAVVLSACGCKSSAVNDGNAIDITLLVDSTVSDEDLARAANLDLEVTGAESYSNPQIVVAGKLDAKSRTAGLRYRPTATSGTIMLRVDLIDGAGTLIASGAIGSIVLTGGTQVFTLPLSKGGNEAMCGNGVVDPGELCDSGAGSATPCPQSVADCDDMNSCTTDDLTGSGCQVSCTHTAVANATGCMAGATTGVCLAGACCTGCIKNGVCVGGTTDASACGSGGNDCFDCTKNSATATCNNGTCSGCDATSCTADGRTCGTSSCGFNCGGCADGCTNGAITHYACVNKSCQTNGSGNCGLYAACASSSTCATSCTGDNGCVATAWCGGSVCKPKVVLGGACSAESTGDHECAAPYVCSWAHDGSTAYCTSGRCTGCSAATTGGNCGGAIDFGKNPRNYCTTQNSCHQAYCSGVTGGSAGLCDYGGDLYLPYRSCGAVSCTNNGSGIGVLSGSICTPSNSCQPSQTEVCTDGNQTCWPCNSTANGCNFGAPFQC